MSERVYAVYKGDNFLTMGNDAEIKQAMNWKRGTFYQLKNHGLNRCAKDLYQNRYFFVDVTDIEEDINDI